MSFYVHHVTASGHEGWTGPIRLPGQAYREAVAWRRMGDTADVVESTPELRATVRRWQHEADLRHGRTHRSGKSSYGHLRKRAAPLHTHAHGGGSGDGPD